MAARVAKVELFKDRKKEWRWRVRAKNGKLIATAGEGFKRPSGAMKSFFKLRSIINYCDYIYGEGWT